MTTPAKPALPELLPCPFCGSQPSDYAIEPHEHALTVGGWKMPDHPGSHVVECGCGAGLIDDTAEAVIRRWNQRAAIDAAVAEARAVPPLVMADGGAPLLVYLASAAPEDTIMDEWTRGYEECKRRLHRILAPQLSATPSPTEPAMPAERTCVECGGALQWRCPACRIAQSAQAAMPAERVALSEETLGALWEGHVLPMFGGAKNGINPIVYARAVIAEYERVNGITPAQGNEEQG